MIIRRTEISSASRTRIEYFTLETEIAKSEAKEQVLATIMEAAPRSFVPIPTSLEPRKGEGNISAPGIGKTVPLVISRSRPFNR